MRQCRQDGGKKGEEDGVEKDEDEHCVICSVSGGRVSRQGNRERMVSIRTEANQYSAIQPRHV